jgi:hypothetical protein
MAKWYSWYCTSASFIISLEHLNAVKRAGTVLVETQLHRNGLQGHRVVGRLGGLKFRSERVPNMATRYGPQIIGIMGTNMYAAAKDPNVRTRIRQFLY